MQFLQHNLPTGWLPGAEHTTPILNIMRGCAQRRVLAGAGREERRTLPMLTTPRRGPQFVLTRKIVRMTCGLGFDGGTLIQRSIATDVEVEVFCEGVVNVSKRLAVDLDVHPTNYVILSMREVPGRFGRPETIHLTPVFYCPATRLWQPLCDEGDSFRSVSFAPTIGPIDADTCTIPSFDVLLGALRGAPVA